MESQRFDLNSRQFKANPFPVLAQLREAGPLVRARLPLVGDAWLATNYEAVARVLRDQQNFALDSANAGKRQRAGLRWWMPRVFRLLAQNMLTMDEPDHRRLRGLVEQAFQRQSVEKMHARIEELAERFLDQVETAAERTGQADFIEHFARPFPLAVICELLGLPEADRPKFSLWASRLTTASSALGAILAMPGIWKLLAYLRREFAARRQDPRPGVISALVQAEQDGQRLSEDELLAMAFLLLFAGHETTVHLISSGVLTLLDHPDQKAKLLADWQLAGSAVDEVLRYASPVQMSKPRYARHDLELFGQKLKRGEFVIALLAGANADPEHFPDPERLDIERHPNQHMTFGSGIHICLGLKLARAEAAIAFEKLFTRFPNVEVGVPQQELKWNARLGLRSVAAMPLRLHAPGHVRYPMAREAPSVTSSDAHP